MLVKAWFTRSTVERTRKHKRYNNEQQHALSSKTSTEKKRVNAQDKHFVDLTWCYDTLCVDNKHVHFVDYGRQENMRKIDNLRLSSVLVVNDSSSAQAMGSCDSDGGS